MSFKSSAKELIMRYVPRSIQLKIAFFYGLNQSAVSYSQYGEDLIIASYVKRLGLKCGRVLDIGAFHPKWYSNTYSLFKGGWTGTVVDLEEEKLSSFRLVHGDKVNTVYAAVTPETQMPISRSITAYKFKKLLSLFDTIDRATAERWREAFRIEFVEQTVPAVTIAELFDAYGPFDVVNIDIEGIDEAIVLEIDFNRYRPRLVLYEDNDLFGGSEAISEHFRRFGYQRLCVTGGTVIYADFECLDAALI